MRKKIFNWLRRNHPEGQLLTNWLIFAHWALFPVSHTHWLLSGREGYQPLYDHWIIDGVAYSGAALRALSESKGETYTFTRVGDCLQITRDYPKKSMD